MELDIKQRYYKRSLAGRDPIRFTAKQPGGIGTDVHGVTWLDPVLRNEGNADLREALLKHEMDEIKAWGQGEKASHTTAKGREPVLLRQLGGVTGFWREIKRRQKQAGGSRTFPTWKAAHEYAKQKRKEGYQVEGCSGASIAKQQSYTVVFSKGNGHKPKEVPYLYAYAGETPDHIVARMAKEHRQPLRSKAAIVNLARSVLAQARISGIKVLVKQIPADNPHTDAAVRYTQVKGVIKPDQLIIHPMHQYTSEEKITNKIKHELDHLQGKQFATEKVKIPALGKAHVELIPARSERHKLNKPYSHKPRVAGVYSDSHGQRISRRHHKGWKRIY